MQFSYMGTHFRGLQKQNYRIKEDQLSESEISSMYEKDEVTVQGALESAVWNVVKPPNPVKVVTSSRTDKGVHALVNTAHVDLLPSTLTGSYFLPREITKLVNLWMVKKNLDVRLKRTVAVPATFHCRFDVVSRCYLYRVAVTPEISTSAASTLNSWPNPPFEPKRKHRGSRSIKYNRETTTKLSFLENERYYEVQCKEGQHFDFELFKETLEIMQGEHNFSNFTKSQGHFKYYTVEGKKYTKFERSPSEMTKEVSSIEVINQPPPLPSSIFPIYGEEDVHFIDIIIKGNSFLHNQIRRMVGAALSVGIGKISKDEVNDLLENPDKGWNSKFFVAPPDGLYLAQIKYREGALDESTESYEQMMALSKVQFIKDFSFERSGYLEHDPLNIVEDT